jgi:DNA replication ATP-dependent helicase Dna2
MSQGFTRLEPGDEPSTLWAYLGDTKSRFREGDMILLHAGDPSTTAFGRGLSLEAEGEDRW